LRKISLQQLPIPTTHLWQLGKKTHQLGILASGEALRILTPIARRRLFPRAWSLARFFPRVLPRDVAPGDKVRSQIHEDDDANDPGVRWRQRSTKTTTPAIHDDDDAGDPGDSAMVLNPSCAMVLIQFATARVQIQSLLLLLHGRQRWLLG
jgi:hypothetical protein